jgi:hypothetical protein
MKISVEVHCKGAVLSAGCSALTHTDCDSFNNANKILVQNFHPSHLTTTTTTAAAGLGDSSGDAHTLLRGSMPQPMNHPEFNRIPVTPMYATTTPSLGGWLCVCVQRPAVRLSPSLSLSVCPPPPVAPLATPPPQRIGDSTRPMSPPPCAAAATCRGPCSDSCFTSLHTVQLASLSAIIQKQHLH